MKGSNRLLTLSHLFTYTYYSFITNCPSLLLNRLANKANKVRSLIKSISNYLTYTFWNLNSYLTSNPITVIKILPSIPVVLSTLFSITIRAAVLIEAANILLKRQETCGDLEGCLAFTLKDYYVNVCLLILFLYLLRSF